MAHRQWVVNASPLILLGKTDQIGLLGESAAADRFTEPDIEPWNTPSTRVNNAARALYRKITDRL